MRRRTFVAGTCTCALAGCIDIIDGSSVLAPGDTTSISEDGSLGLDEFELARSVIEHHIWKDIHEPPDTQFVRASVDIDEADDESAIIDTLHLRVDGSRHDAGVDLPAVPLALDRSTIAFPVSVISADSATIEYASGDGPRWEVPTDIVERFSAKPTFRLEDATVDYTGNEPALELTVSNVGDRDGTFKALAISAIAADASEPITLAVPAGETITERVHNTVIADWPEGEPLEHDVDERTRSFAVYYP